MMTRLLDWAKLRVRIPIKWFLADETWGCRLAPNKWIRAEPCAMGYSRVERPLRVNQWRKQNDHQWIKKYTRKGGLHNTWEAKLNKDNGSLGQMLPWEGQRRTGNVIEPHRGWSWVCFSGTLWQGSAGMMEVWTVLVIGMRILRSVSWARKVRNLN